LKTITFSLDPTDPYAPGYTSTTISTYNVRPGGGIYGVRKGGMYAAKKQKELKEKEKEHQK
jgi:hypothetical protein